MHKMCQIPHPIHASVSLDLATLTTDQNNVSVGNSLFRPQFTAVQ